MTSKYHLSQIRDSKTATFSVLKLLIGIVIFSLFVLVLGEFYVGMMETYNIPVSEKYQTNYDKLTKMTNISTDIGQQLQGGKLTDTNTLILAGQSVYSVGQIMLNSITLPYEIIKQFGQDQDLGIPPIFLTAAITILTLVVVWAAFGLFSRWIA